jgi:pimeloyl-ACP methyl ester carboxylesterase
MMFAMTRRTAFAAVAGAFAAAALPQRALAEGEVTIRRSFVDTRFGQMHVRIARPGDAGALRAPPLLCLHQTPLSGGMFSAFMQAMAKDRIVLAPDTHGYGESDPPPAPQPIANYAASFHDMAAAQGHTAFDVLGYHTGTVLAVEMALQKPQTVRRLVLASLPLFSEERRLQLLAAPELELFKSDGSEVMAQWNSGFKARGPGQTDAMIDRNFQDKIRAGNRQSWAIKGVFAYPLREKLTKLPQPTLVLRSGDSLWDGTGEAAAIIPNATRLDRAEMGHGLFDAFPEKLAADIGAFLRPGG